MATLSSHGTTFAVFYETTPGQPPGYVALTTPQGTAAGWASAEGSTADRHRVHEADPSWLRRSNIEDPAVTPRVFAKNVPIAGLRTADGGSAVITLHGSEASTADSSQVSETSLMRILKHCLGGLKRGYTTDVAAAPTSTVDYSITSATGLEAGMFVGLEDADATGLVWPQRVLTISGTAITTDRVAPFTIAVNDVVHAAATAYIDTDALTNVDDADYQTVSILIQKNEGTPWLGVGGKMQLDSIEFPRNEVPRLSLSLYSSAAYAPGSDSISAPTWTGTVQGDSGNAVGARTYLYIQTFGSTTANCYDAESVAVEVGVPVVPIDTRTQCDELEGRAGYTTEAADTILSATVLLDTSWASGFDATTAYTVTYCRVGPAGDTWVVQLPKAYLKEAPTYADASGTQWHSLQFVAHEDAITTGSTDELIKSKLLIGVM